MHLFSHEFSDSVTLFPNVKVTPNLRNLTSRNVCQAFTNTDEVVEFLKLYIKQQPTFTISLSKFCRLSLIIIVQALGNLIEYGLTFKGRKIIQIVLFVALVLQKTHQTDIPFSCSVFFSLSRYLITLLRCKPVLVMITTRIYKMQNKNAAQVKKKSCNDPLHLLS